MTECGLSDRLAMEVPDKQFLKGCKLCAFMKVTTLEDVRDSLKYLQHDIVVPEDFLLPPGGLGIGRIGGADGIYAEPSSTVVLTAVEELLAREPTAKEAKVLLDQLQS